MRDTLISWTGTANTLSLAGEIMMGQVNPWKVKGFQGCLEGEYIHVTAH